MCMCVPAGWVNLTLHGVVSCIVLCGVVCFCVVVVNVGLVV